MVTLMGIIGTVNWLFSFIEVNFYEKRFRKRKIMA